MAFKQRVALWVLKCFTNSIVPARHEAEFYLQLDLPLVIQSHFFLCVVSQNSVIHIITIPVHLCV